MEVKSTQVRSIPQRAPWPLSTLDATLECSAGYWGAHHKHLLCYNLGGRASTRVLLLCSSVRRTGPRAAQIIHHQHRSRETLLPRKHGPNHEPLNTYLFDALDCELGEKQTSWTVPTLRMFTLSLEK